METEKRDMSMTLLGGVNMSVVQQTTLGISMLCKWTLLPDVCCSSLAAPKTQQKYFPKRMQYLDRLMLRAINLGYTSNS